MLSFFAAASAPLRIRSQNESPGTSWVIIAIVMRGVSTVPPPPPPPFDSCFPPILEQDAIPTTSTLARERAARRLYLISPPLFAQGRIASSALPLRASRRGPPGSM